MDGCGERIGVWVWYNGQWDGEGVCVVYLYLYVYLGILFFIASLLFTFLAEIRWGCPFTLFRVEL